MGVTYLLGETTDPGYQKVSPWPCSNKRWPCDLKRLVPFEEKSSLCHSGVQRFSLEVALSYFCFPYPVTGYFCCDFFFKEDELKSFRMASHTSAQSLACPRSRTKETLNGELRLRYKVSRRY